MIQWFVPWQFATPSLRDKGVVAAPPWHDDCLRTR